VSDTLVRPPGPRSDEPTPDEDPRLARRRRAVEEAPRRRRRRNRVGVAAVVAVVVAAGGATRTPLLDVDRITVSGTHRVDRARVLAATGLSVGDPIVDVDAAAVRRRVMAVPGVASAAVDVRWPSSVAVRVTEERPLARLLVGGGEVEVARGGRILGRPDAAAAALVALQVDGLAARDLRAGTEVPAAVRDALVVLEQMPADLLRRLPTATLDRSGSLGFAVADDGGTVRFGPPEDVPAKVLATVTMLSGAVELKCLDVLDVREPTRPTISRRGGCAVPAPTVGATTTTPRSTTKPTTTPTPGTTTKSPPTTTSRSTTTTVAVRGR
jgi:cell division protein FtsQ